jgi:hypothetical protein
MKVSYLNIEYSKKLDKIFSKVFEKIKKEGITDTDFFEDAEDSYLVNYDLNEEESEVENRLEIGCGKGILEKPSMFEDLKGTGNPTLAGKSKRSGWEYVVDNDVKNIKISSKISSNAFFKTLDGQSIYLFRWKEVWIPYGLSFVESKFTRKIKKAGFVNIVEGKIEMKDWVKLSQHYEEVIENLHEEQKDLVDKSEKYIEFIEEEIGIENLVSMGSVM